MLNTATVLFCQEAQITFPLHNIPLLFLSSMTSDKSKIKNNCRAAHLINNNTLVYFRIVIISQFNLSRRVVIVSLRNTLGQLPLDC